MTLVCLLAVSRSVLGYSTTAITRTSAASTIFHGHHRPRAFTGHLPRSTVRLFSSSPTSGNDAKERRRARDRRKKFIGLAKAVDRGQFTNTYQPRPFQARSGLPDITQPFTVLGIESSCDDTGAAVVRSDGVLLGEALASQADLHQAWGGVVPGLARDAHEQAIDQVIHDALQRAGMQSVQDVDAIGVTVGPGLEICLRVGCTRAQELAIRYQKPFVAVHHLEAHVLMARLPSDTSSDSTTTTPNVPSNVSRAFEFPFLALLVSGGHCQLMECTDIGAYRILGGTLDDSLGEAFDKTARLLGLPVGGGGGPAVERLAREGNPQAVPLPIPLRTRKDCDFSYAGLKTAVRLAAEKLRTECGAESIVSLPDQAKADICASFQNVAIQHIEQRLKYAMDAMEKTSGIRTLALVGGVAANQELRRRVEAQCQGRDWTLHVPPPRLCTDQGAMSAWAAIERLLQGSSDDPYQQEVYARYPFAVESESTRDSAV